MNFNQSTQEMIGYIRGGLRVETSTLNNASYLLTGNTQTELFNIKGRLLILQLYLEILSAGSNHATTVYFNTTFTTPVIAVNPMCAASAALNSNPAAPAQGLRVVFVGGIVATAAIVTDTAGLTDVTCVTPHIVGGHGFVGTIGMLTAAASQTQGTFRVILHYLPYSDGAYAEAAL